jgi:hypothetical protein
MVVARWFAIKRASCASRGLIERALQRPEDGGLADLVIGRQANATSIAIKQSCD